ncbi:UBX domain protein Ubx2 [Sporothrix epigloea]|uniref:UBX domain protein Ubx2 n=1 Tax=Sporothrix epigloea TaxID=1892477 RepID=A0ABP0DKU0_9PEZI
MDDGLVASFVSITGASEVVARQLLEIAGGNIEQAAVLFYDTDMVEALARQDTAATLSQWSGTPTSNSRTASSTRRNQLASAQSQHLSWRPPQHHEDTDGVITIDDSDDNDFNMDSEEPEDLEDFDDDEDDDLIDTSTNDAAAVAQKAQEEEDAAMAKRLQNEMYSEAPTGARGAGDDELIRAPIGRTTEMLVDSSYSGGFGEYDDASYEQLRMNFSRRRIRGGPQNPFNQIVSDFPDSQGSNSGQLGGVTDRRSPTAPSGRERLEALFRPPFDLIERVSSWDEARSIGKDQKRWILANIQDMSDFGCQVLNRDHWKDKAIRQLVGENFLFLQYDKHDLKAQSYINYYMPGGQDDNLDNFPHIGVVDPRTGEQVKVWSGRPFPEVSDFHAQLVEFLDRYSLDATKKNPVQRTKPQVVIKNVDRMTEDEMLEMALQNSLAMAGNSTSATENGNMIEGTGNGTVQDPDELTTTPAPEAKAETEEQAEEDANSLAFAAIASDHPHEEPPTTSSVVSTRIQFRHPNGRVIRRFAVDDHVVIIYEWLKAAPLEGRERVAFELKAMPQGQDLLEVLDKTIEEAGLKQATVMIEFLE